MATTIESTSDEQGDTVKVAEISEAITTHGICCLSPSTDVSATLKKRALAHAVTGIREQLGGSPSKETVSGSVP